MIRRTCLAAACALVLAGCGTEGRPPASPAGGKVAYRKSQPTPGALVVFHPTDPAFEKRIGGKPFAKVRDDGTFALTTYEDGDGAPEGDYGVTIDWRPPAKENKAGFSLGEGGSGLSKLGPKYGNPQSPAFKVTVKKGDANQFTFDVD